MDLSVLQQSSNDSNKSSAVETSGGSPRHQVNHKPKSPKPSEYVKAGGRKAKGSRHSRRFENLNYLLSLVDNEEFGEIDMCDLIEPSVSAFAELLSEEEKMEIWNDFINHTEEEQAVFLQNQCYPSTDELACDGDDEDSENLEEWTELVDERSADPAFSAEEKFSRIDAKSRALLQRRQLPKGILTHLEDELTTFFCEWPDSVYVQTIPNSFQRLLLHAICQYMDLKSQSLYLENYKHTQVENRHEDFTPPAVPLSAFVDSRKH